MKIPYYLLIIGLIIILGMVVITSTANTLIIQTEQDFDEEEVNELLDEIYNDISTYIKIDRAIGIYQTVDNQRILSKIAIQVHSLFSKDIQIKDMVIEISNGDQIKYFSNIYFYDTLENHSLFAHPLFNQISEGSFGVISISDKDDSISGQQLINHNSDRFFIIINLTDVMKIKSGDYLSLTLVPSVGTIRTIEITPPFSTKPVVDLLK